MNQAWKAVLVYTVALTLIIQALAVLAGPAPPAVNTIQQGRGVNMPTAEFHDYFFRGVNLTDLFITIAEYIANYTGPMPVWEPTVEWGLVYGTTGDWFNHTLPGEPIYIGLEMHPDNLDYDGALITPRVYDKDATHWQLALYFYNGTQVLDSHDMLVMYHMRWAPPVNGEAVDPNEPQLPLQGPPT